MHADYFCNTDAVLLHTEDGKLPVGVRLIQGQRNTHTHNQVTVFIVKIIM